MVKRKGKVTAATATQAVRTWSWDIMVPEARPKRAVRGCASASV